MYDIMESGLTWAKANGVAIITDPSLDNYSDYDKNRGTLTSCAYWSQGGSEAVPLLGEICAFFGVCAWNFFLLECAYNLGPAFPTKGRTEEDMRWISMGLALRDGNAWEAQSDTIPAPTVVDPTIPAPPPVVEEATVSE